MRPHINALFMKPLSSMLFLLIAILFNVLTSIFFKFSSFKDYDKLKVIFFMIGLLFGIGNSYFYVKSLKTANLNVVFPVYSAGNIILLTVISYLIFNESFTLIKTGGILLVICGIYLISKP
jgi:multidrug transporter EmrE-like cation transporter